MKVPDSPKIEAVANYCPSNGRECMTSTCIACESGSTHTVNFATKRSKWTRII
jgi:hypothetical protein